MEGHHILAGMYANQTKITNNNMNLRSSIPDVITIGQRFNNRDTNLFIGKIFHYDVPSKWNIRNDDIYSWDQTISLYGRDKIEEYKVNTLNTRKYGGTLKLVI